ELQRDGDEAVNEICVPGQIGLFQEYLSKVSGMYYLDVPKAYRSPSITSVIKVGDLSDLLNKDLSVLLSKKV
ncbi:MAG: hypothetical protein EBQ92_02445, partial [Proteobacteria bacterium]|nr:hypothetical protein [Pseudomonadota bacterium]